MTQAAERKGRCLCGAVEVSGSTVDQSVAACHCSMCRKWGGGPLLAVDGGGDFRIAGDENVAVYRSSAWAERGFCRRCGTHLFYRLLKGGHYFVPVGLFDDGTWKLEQQIFVDEKPDFYAFANATRNLTGAEVFAQFAPPQP